MPRARRPRSLAALALVAALAAFPLGALASHQFADVPDSNPFHADISALANSGVTSGCGGGNYCPSANVTREQMAAFLNRLGALAPGKTPVVNADKLDGFDSTDFLLGEQVTTTQMGPWFVTSGSATLTHMFDRERLSAAGAGTSSMAMRIVAPAALDGHNFGLRAIQFCWLAGVNDMFIDSVTVFDVSSAANSGISDGTDVTPTGTAQCLTLQTSTVPPPVQGGMTVSLTATFTGAGLIDISSVRMLWELGTQL